MNQEEEIARLREALREIAAMRCGMPWILFTGKCGAQEIALKALGDEEEPLGFTDEPIHKPTLDFIDEVMRPQSTASPRVSESSIPLPKAE